MDPTQEGFFERQVSVDGEAALLEVLYETDELRSMQDGLVRKSECFILVFSLASRSSLRDVEEYARSIVRIKDAEDLSTIPMVLVALTPDGADHDECFEVSRQEALMKADALCCPLFVTSVASGVDVEESFRELLRLDRAAQRKSSTRTSRSRSSRRSDSSSSSDSSRSLGGTYTSSPSRTSSGGTNALPRFYASTSRVALAVWGRTFSAPARMLAV